MFSILKGARDGRNEIINCVALPNSSWYWRPALLRIIGLLKRGPGRYREVDSKMTTAKSVSPPVPRDEQHVIQYSEFG